MIRIALTIVVVGTVLGAMMPSGSRSPAAGNDSNNSSSTIVEASDSPGSFGSDAQSTANGEVKLHRFYDGHFYADASVNGAPVHFLVDTGATGIALTADDARRASIALSPGQGEVIGTGAGGELRGEFVTLDRVALGHKEARDIAGAVIQGGEQSLLGQNFLAKFDSVEIHGDEMVLR